MEVVHDRERMRHSVPRTYLRRLRRELSRLRRTAPWSWHDLRRAAWCDVHLPSQGDGSSAGDRHPAARDDGSGRRLRALPRVQQPQPLHGDRGDGVLPSLRRALDRPPTQPPTTATRSLSLRPRREEVSSTSLPSDVEPSITFLTS